MYTESTTEALITYKGEKGIFSMSMEGQRSGEIRAKKIQSENVVSGVQIQGANPQQADALESLVQAVQPGGIDADEINASNTVDGLQYLSGPAKAIERDALSRVPAKDLEIHRALIEEQPVVIPADKIETNKRIIQGKIENNAFDVFLCHNSRDKSEVKRIGIRLIEEYGLLPWLDEWNFRPGFSWQDILDRQIRLIKTVAVFVGKDGMGPWQHQEAKAFLRRFVRNEYPLIPVFLEDAPPEEPELPDFLDGLQYVDFRQQNSNAMEKLRWGITGEAPSAFPY